MVVSESNAKKTDPVSTTGSDKKPNLEDNKVTIENKKSPSGKDDVVKESSIDRELLQVCCWFYSKCFLMEKLGF